MTENGSINVFLNEEATTMPLLELLASGIENISGRLILVSLSSADPYISTLDKAYYVSANGRKLLDLVHEYRPTIYLELHSYEIKNHAKLTDPDRKSKIKEKIFASRLNYLFPIQKKRCR